MKAPTQNVEIQGIVFGIPTGPMTPPTAEAERIMAAQQNKENWKLPTGNYYTYDKTLADALAYCYDWYCGGAEIEVVEINQYGTLYRVASQGYYHYIGT